MKCVGLKFRDSLSLYSRTCHGCTNCLAVNVYVSRTANDWRPAWQHFQICTVFGVVSNNMSWRDKHVRVIQADQAGPNRWIRTPYDSTPWRLVSPRSEQVLRGSEPWAVDRIWIWFIKIGASHGPEAMNQDNLSSSAAHLSYWLVRKRYHNITLRYRYIFQDDGDHNSNHVATWVSEVEPKSSSWCTFLSAVWVPNTHQQ